MSNFNAKLGIKNGARSPGSIVNVQHHDPSGAERDMSGSAATIKEIIADSTVETPIANRAVLRVFNQTAGVEYIFVGEEGTAPGSVDATNGLALTPQFYENLYVGISSDPAKSIVIKSSSSQVQVVVMED